MQKPLQPFVMCIVNNAFAVSHRDQASVTGITRYAKSSAAGFLLEKEVCSYYDSVEHPKKPLVVVIGGAKVSSKLAALENYAQICGLHDYRRRHGQYIPCGKWRGHQALDD